MSLDCDDAMLLLVARGQRTLTGLEETHLGDHVTDCAECRALQIETVEDWRWVARMPQDAFDDPDLLVFPVIDPIVFHPGKVIASGGMGRITRVTDRRLGREVALKESLDGTLRSRFEREAAITARLQHPSIVPIYEAGSWPDGSLFYTMRLVDGQDLAAAIGETSTLPERIALLPHVVRVTEALAYAHARKIIHRDLKPANVLVGAYGETVVIDWGIAKELGRTIDDAKLPQLSSKDDLTRSGTILGTPCFMAPEQARSEPIDERADVYALGALLYNLLTGEPPYWDRFKSTELILEYSILHPPTPLRALAPEVPVDLCVIVERAMARAPADRYRDAREMAEELRRFEAGQLIAREYSLRELAVRWLAKHRTSVVIAAIALSVLAVIAVLAVINIRSSRDAEAAARREAETNLAAAGVAAGAALEEQARSEILGGDRAKGVTYASAAYSAGRDTPSLRYLLAVATRDAVRHLTEIGPPALTTSCDAGDLSCAGHDVEAVAYDRDGHLVFVEVAAGISIWSGGRRVRRFAIDAGVGAAAIDPMVQRAAVYHSPAALAMWDLASGKRLWSITEPTLGGSRVDIHFDPTGRYVVAVSDDDKQRKVAVRDAATGAVVSELVVGKREITAVAFSPDGTRIAACDPDGDVKVWTIAGQEVVAWTADPGAEALTFLGNDRIVIDNSRTTGRTASIWSLGTSAHLIKVLPRHAGTVVRLFPAPDGNTLVTSDSEMLRLWDRDGALIAESGVARARFEAIVFTPTAIVGAALDPRLFVFERATLAPRAIVPAHNSELGTLAVDPTNTRIVTTGGSDQRVHEWSMPPGVELTRVAGGDAVWFDGRLAVATPTGVQFYRGDTGAPDGKVDAALGGDLTLSVAGDSLLAHGAKGQFAIGRDGRVRSLAETTLLVPSRDGRYALAEDQDGDPPTDGLRVWDVAAGTVERTLPVKHWNEALIVRDTVVVNSGRRISIFEIATGRKIASTQLAETDAYNLARSPSGKLLIAWNTKRMLVIDPATGAEHSRLDSPSDISAVFVRDDQLVITSTESGTWAWDVPTGKLQTLIDRSTGPHDSSGGTIAIADRNHVRLVRSALGRQLDAIAVVSDPIKRVAFNLDGSRLLIATGSAVVVLDVHLETRDARAIEAIANQIPWKVEQGVAVPR